MRTATLEHTLDILPAGVFGAELSDSQKSAIKYSIKLGRTIQEEFPQIAEDYRRGSSLMDIVRKYNLHKQYDVGESTARNAVHMALSGYSRILKLFNAQQYSGLISEKEMKTLGREHSSERGRLLGIVCGRASGLAQYKNGIGIHAQTPEERRAAVQLAHTAQGNTIWSEHELKFLFYLTEQREYQRKTRINSKKISAELNRLFHDEKDIRTQRSVTKAVYRARE